MYKQQIPACAGMTVRWVPVTYFPADAKPLAGGVALLSRIRINLRKTLVY